MNPAATHPAQPHVTRAPDFASALAMVAADASSFVEVFVGSWIEVDTLRARVASLGLAARIGIHHQAALDTLIDLNVLPPSGPRTSPPTSHAQLHRLDSFIRAAAASLAARLSLVLTR